MSFAPKFTTKNSSSIQLLTIYVAQPRRAFARNGTPDQKSYVCCENDTLRIGPRTLIVG